MHQVGNSSEEIVLSYCAFVKFYDAKLMKIFEMETSEILHSKSKELRKHNTTNKINGLNNWMLAFFVILCFNLVFENVVTYGIRKTPIELTYDFIGFLEINWWCYVLMFSGYLFQILLCYSNEKFLAMGILPEKVGMAFHVFIALFSFNLCSILCLVYKFNPVAGIVAMAHIFLITVKFWGYAYQNKKLREVYLRNQSTKYLDINGKVSSEDEVAKKTISYPDNVTLKRTFQFLACTGACTYKINGPSSKPTNLKKVLKRIVLIILGCYTAALLIHQFILPEVDKTTSYIDNGQYFNVFGSVLKLALPVNLAWLLFFYFYCFGFYLPVFGLLWGTEDIIVAEDWWNSENSTIFWTKWNYQVHIWLKECFFLPTLHMGYSKRTAALVVACVSGILHEYLISVPCRCCYGVATLTMLGQIPLAYLTTFIQRKYGDKWGNMTLWLFLIFGHSSSTILMYYNYRSL